MVESLLSHPRLQNLRLTILATADAHGLYERFGFEVCGAEFLEDGIPHLPMQRP